MLNNTVTGAPEEIRTPDPQIRSLVLYPAELRARCAARKMAACGAGHSYRLRCLLASARLTHNLRLSRRAGVL